MNWFSLTSNGIWNGFCLELDYDLKLDYELKILQGILVHVPYMGNGWKWKMKHEEWRLWNSRL